ncbi:unnamed protein product [Heligmosomoides polygyrus]|uniref:Uncharacterized protein n=1 Tax=Heligmosomoides polygyrus TaxID=6339 RepID=A0A183GGZ8_HELPZ|nr:unnamed protein product [Heligmosomoides polygyrus]
MDEQGEPPYTPNFIGTSLYQYNSFSGNDIATFPAAGLDAYIDDRRADFSTSMLTMLIIACERLTNFQKMRLEEGFLKKLSGNRFLKMQFGKHRLLSSTTVYEILSRSLRRALLDMDEVRTLEHRSTALSQSSDLIVREVSAIMHRLVVGTTIALDTCLAWCRELQKDSAKNTAQVARVTSNISFPKGTIFSAGNLTKHWKVLERGETDHSKLLRNWSPHARTPKHQPYLLSVDFLRSYLAQACTPCQAVKQFAVRLNGKSGKGNLSDFPENMTSLLIGMMSAATGRTQRPTSFFRPRSGSARPSSLDACGAPSTANRRRKPTTEEPPRIGTITIGNIISTSSISTSYPLRIVTRRRSKDYKRLAH